ncbi:hypothetical protein FGE12_23995 [Aggregicoccus sp. 17bor-14]|uniref:hypothetical protein n=1 Tax=Myxococcaceae TaxID=31 RepID=UPI00129C7160|nr:MULTISPECIES: hypothetical protein [Myxococcaceae]MBF5045491.1 hypothetical protein [Simulacricoccus sp. 17bor-14]MRI91228.1 hypothetical protein [Aggregicoccus sp. 17bor-14]
MGWFGGAVMVAALGAASPVALERTPAAAPEVSQQETAALEAALVDASTDAPAAAPQAEAPAQVAQADELAAAAMSYPSSVCKKKRVDACGCHHVYGVRHCHPDRRSKHCEALASIGAPWLQTEPLDLADALAQR